MPTITYLSIIKYVLKTRGICSCTHLYWTSNYHLNDKNTLRKKNITSIKIFLRIQSLIYIEHTGLRVAWLDCRLKEGPGQCRNNTWCWTGTVCGNARKPYLSHYIISVTVPHNYVWLYRCKLRKERPPELSDSSWNTVQSVIQSTAHCHWKGKSTRTFILNNVIASVTRNTNRCGELQGLSLRPWNTNSSVLTFLRLKLGWN